MLFDEKAINLRLELTRDTTSDDMILIAHFYPDAPNFFHTTDRFTWRPTKKELKLLVDAYDLIQHRKHTHKPEESPSPPVNNPLISRPYEKTETEQPWAQTVQSDHRSENKNATSDTRSSDIHNEKNVIDTAVERYLERDQPSQSNDQKKIEKILQKKGI